MEILEDLQDNQDYQQQLPKQSYEDPSTSVSPLSHSMNEP